MGIQIIIPDTDNLNDQDRQVLAVVAGTTIGIKADTTPAPAAAAPAAAKKAAPAKKAAAPAKPDPEPEPEAADEEEDLLGTGEPTMADAVAKATELVGAGRGADVKAALTSVGVGRVSELKPANIADFLAALD